MIEPELSPAQVDNGKAPDDPVNAKTMLRLPTDTPFGDLTLKFMKLRWRVDEANRRLAASYRSWQVCRTGKLASPPGAMPPGAYEQHIYANEEAVHHMRRSADEIIAMLWTMNYWKERGEWPSRIEVDSIAVALSPEHRGRLSLCVRHEPLLRRLNEIANAYKHSFVNSDITILGRDEPCVHALGLERNRLEAGARFHNIRLAKLVSDFSSFYGDAIAELAKYQV